MNEHWPISIITTVSSLICMLLPLILVRIFDAATLGTFKIFFLYLMVLPPITFIAGLSSGLSYWGGRGEKGRKAIQNSGILFLFISLTTLIILLSLENFLISFLNIERQWVHLFSYALFLGIATLFYDDAAIATGRIWTGALFNSSFELLRAGMMISVAIVTRDLASVIKAHLFIQFLKAIVGYGLAYKHDLLKWNHDKELMRSIVKYAFPVSLAFIFGLWLNYSDQIILSKMITSTEFAIYTVCCLTVPPLLILEASVTRVLIPKLSKEFKENHLKEASILYSKSITELAFLIIPSVVGLIVFASPIIEILFTRSYLIGTHYLRLYALWYLPLIIPPDSIARARGESKWILYNFMFFSALTLILCFLFGYDYGATGVLSGLILSRACSRFYTIYSVHTKLKQNILEFIPIRSLIKISTYSILLGSGSYFSHVLFKSDIKWFLVMGFLFVIIYFYLGLHLIINKKMNQKKLLIITPGLEMGGLERMILNLSKGLKSNTSFEPVVVAYDFIETHSSNELVSLFRKHEIKVILLNKGNGFSFKTILKLIKIIKKEEINLIHTHDLGALIYGSILKILLLGHTRLIHTQHSFVHLNQNWKYKYYEMFFPRFTDQIVAVSESILNQYCTFHFGRQKINMIPNGVEFPEVLKPNRSQKQKILNRSHFLDFKSSKVDFWILYLARIHSGKGQNHGVEIWNELSDETRSHSLLLFVGPETDQDALSILKNKINHAKNKENIHLIGPTSIPEKWISISDLFLSCSEFEGMPLSPIEAIGAGLPAVLSDIEGHRFLAQASKQYPLDKPALGAKYIQYFYNESLKNNSQINETYWNQSQNIRETYTLITMTHAYIKIYERFL